MQMASDDWQWFLEVAAKLQRPGEDAQDVVRVLEQATTRDDFIAMIRSLSQPDLGTVLAKLRLPVLVVLGSGHGFASRADAACQMLAESIDGARLVRHTTWSAIQDELLAFFSMHHSKAAAPAGTDVQPSLVLSRREVEILRLLAAGKTNHEIATELSLSWHTVAKHVGNILNKTGAVNRTAAATFGAARGLL
jgi:DNA-binding CsgD family transcriptional regulator